MNIRCDLCKYWEKSENLEPDGKLGWCHRYPPTISMGDPEDSYRHIESWNNDWCGEFINNT